ncbi:MAG: UPF0149 family protein [Halioglobus sp.]
MFDELTPSVGVFDFEELANQLLEQGSAVSPARLHGMLAGLLSAGAQPIPELGLDAASHLLEVSAYGELAEQIMQLYTVTAGALADEEFEFHPLLPDDEEALDVRTEALADWSAGFLLGFAQQNGKTPEQSSALSTDSSEILSDMAAMAEASMSEEEDGEEDEAESHYWELVEYVRFATLNVYMDIRIAQRDEDVAPENHSIH